MMMMMGYNFFFFTVLVNFIVTAVTSKGFVVTLITCGILLWTAKLSLKLTRLLETELTDICQEMVILFLLISEKWFSSFRGETDLEECP